MASPTRPPRRLWRNVATALALVGAAFAAVLWLGIMRISVLWPLELHRPGGPLVDLQLSDLRYDRVLCRRVLTTPQIEAEPIADRSDGPDCGWTNAVRVARAGGARISVGAATCELSAALALWIEHVVQPKSLEHFKQRVTQVEHLGSYACRNIRGDPAIAELRSEHASANALDVRGFVLADGRRVVVKTHWGDGGPNARFLADVLRASCRYFRVAIGPAYNAAHRDHFHLDRGPERACR